MLLVLNSEFVLPKEMHPEVKIRVNFRVRVRHKVRVCVNDKITIGMVFRVRGRFSLAIQWRRTGGNISAL